MQGLQMRLLVPIQDDKAPWGVARARYATLPRACMTWPLTSARPNADSSLTNGITGVRTVEWASALGSQHPAPRAEDALAQNTNTRLRAWVTRSSAQRPGTDTEDSEPHKISCRIFSYCKLSAVVADGSDNLKRPEQAHASRSQDQKCPGLGRGKSPPQTCFIYPQLVVFVISKSNCITHNDHKQPGLMKAIQDDDVPHS